jgi:aerobic carbon-monoxide dehydrogenase large subunit
MGWTESRSENYQATIHGRDVIQDLELTATRDGRVLGVPATVYAVDTAAWLLHVPGHLQVRGAHPHLPSRVHQIIERIMDELAAEYTTVAGLTYDSGNCEAATAKALELFG